MCTHFSDEAARRERRNIKFVLQKLPGIQLIFLLEWNFNPRSQTDCLRSFVHVINLMFSELRDALFLVPQRKYGSQTIEFLIYVARKPELFREACG